MGKDKNHNKDTFQKVMRGLAQRTPSAAERAKDEERARQIKAESDRIQAESRAIARQLDEQRRAEAAHQRAEEDRRKRQS
jgi:hypothetical protein